MILTTFDTIAVLFVLAAMFGYINHRWFKLPFAIGIMTAGLVTSFLLLTANWAFELGLEKPIAKILSDIDFAETLMHGMLSFLLFAGALHTNMAKLKKWAVPIFTLASIGVLISTGVIGGLSYFVFQFVGVPVPLMFCFVFGALITPTDPVAVLGIMKAAGAPPDVEIKVIGESLFNDGVGVVVFAVLLSIAVSESTGNSLGFSSVLHLIAVEVIGGVVLGLLGGYITYRALKSLEEPNLEVLISVALVMGLTFIAFQLHTSAPLACVVAGLFIGNRGRDHAMGEDTEIAIDIVWSFIDEALNAILFLLVGFELFVIQFNINFVLASGLIILVALLGRAMAVYFPITFLKTRVEFRTGTRRILWWGGIKGGISIALALSLPPFEGREVVLAATYATVIASVFFQGLSIGKLIEKLTGDESK